MLDYAKGQESSLHYLPQNFLKTPSPVRHLPLRSQFLTCWRIKLWGRFFWVLLRRFSQHIASSPNSFNVVCTIEDITQFFPQFTNKHINNFKFWLVNSPIMM